MSKLNQRQNFVTSLISNSRDKFKAIFDASPVALVEGFWGKSFEVATVNPAALELFGATSPAQFSTGFNGILAKIPRTILLDLLSARVKGDVFEAEFRLPTLRRHQVCVFMRLAYMPATQAGAQHVVLAFQDFTDRKRHETFLKRLSQIDGLTGLLNHRTILQRLDEEMARARRYGLNLSCIILDLDHFKKVNDTFGHVAGDKCIKEAAAALKDSLRKTDIVGRYGGDEFLAILPETKPDQAAIPMGRFLKAYECKADVTRKGKSIRTGFSIGISGFPGEGMDTAKNLIKAADQALYAAKNSGGNCYRVFINP